MLSLLLTCSLLVLGSALSDHLLPDRLNQIAQSPTVITFASIEGTGEQVCLKMWREWEDALYDLKDRIKRTNSLLEGLRFNRKFAPGIYLGLTPVAKEDADKSIQIVRQDMIVSNPQSGDLENVEYALVMECLDESWRLDQQFRQNQQLRTAVGMEFLAKAIAWMHNQLEAAPDEYGTFQSLSEKLEFNIEMFEKFLGESILDGSEREVSQGIAGATRKALSTYTQVVEKRRISGHIRRCHGDLKVTNLWLCPKRDLEGFALPEFDGRQLLALDGVDFRPDFYYIDTLSDIAMLAVDIEMRLTDLQDSDSEKPGGEAMVCHFLDTYLQDMGESKQEVQALLEYYMTEKALVCAYISKRYDDFLGLAYKYLDIARTHSERLASLSEPLSDE